MERGEETMIKEYSKTAIGEWGKTYNVYELEDSTYMAMEAYRFKNKKRARIKKVLNFDSKNDFRIFKKIQEKAKNLTRQ